MSTRGACTNDECKRELELSKKTLKTMSDYIIELERGQFALEHRLLGANEAAKDMRGLIRELHGALMEANRLLFGGGQVYSVDIVRRRIETALAKAVLP